MIMLYYNIHYTITTDLNLRWIHRKNKYLFLDLTKRLELRIQRVASMYVVN